MVIQVVHIKNWQIYHPLKDEEMLYLRYVENRSNYEIAAISCPRHVSHRQWMEHYFRVNQVLDQPRLKF